MKTFREFVQSGTYDPSKIGPALEEVRKYVEYWKDQTLNRKFNDLYQSIAMKQQQTKTQTQQGAVAGQQVGQLTPQVSNAVSSPGGQ